MANPATAKVGAMVVFVARVGAVFTDAVFRISGVQLDQGSTRLAYRFLPATPAQARIAMGAMGNGGDYAPTLQSLTLNAVTNLAHGLGAAPSEYRVELECATADVGYAVGDRVVLADVAARGECLVSSDATNITVRLAAAVSILNKTTLASVAMTAANWRLRVRAWR